MDIGVFYWWNYTTGLTKKNWWIILVELPTVIPVGGHDGFRGAFHKWGGIPNSWMVYFMENPTKMDDEMETIPYGNHPYFRKPPFT